jgi:signal transduction histidine kinase
MFLLVKFVASGTGLGRYITRLLVELYGGTIWLESEAGKGTSFFYPAISDRALSEMGNLAQSPDLSELMG